jgi:hypothetical protein
MAMTLRLEKDGMTGVVKDGRGVVRGLWFTDPDQARDPSTASAAQAYLEVRGAKFEDNDRLIFTAYKIGHFALPIEPLDDGYLVRLPSATGAKIITSARSSTKPWWKFWRTTPVSTCAADVVVNRGIKKDPVPAAGGSEARSPD